MPEQSLAELIRGLSPGALQIFRRQISALPEKERELAFSRLSGIPELEDIVGRKTPMALLETPKPRQPAQPRMADLPLWQRGLQTIGKPFEWISEHITEPFGAMVTAPFTPAIAGGRQTDESPLAYARRQYEQWKEPEITMPWGGKFRPTKGILETLPWLAVPGAAFGSVGGARIAGALGRLGTAGKIAGAVFEKGGLKAAEELAVGGGTLGKVAGIAAKVVKPIAAVEAIPGKIIGKVAGKVLPKEGKIIPEVGTPPIKPPVPPVVAKAIEEPTNFDRFWELISGKKAVARETARQTTIKTALAEQAARVTVRFEKTDPKKLTFDEVTRIWAEESKPLFKRTALGLPGEFLDEGTRRIRETLLVQNASEYEIKATITAFKNALDGMGVPRKLGVKGGSAYTRLEKVFGKEAVDVLSSPSKLRKLTEPVGVPGFKWGEPTTAMARKQPGLGLEEGVLQPPKETLMPQKPWETPTVVDTRTLEQRKLAGMKLRPTPIGVEEAAVNYLRNVPPDERAKQLAMLPKPTRDVVEDTLNLVGVNLLDAANIPRATMSSLDWSAIGRQGAIATFRHPTRAAQAMLQMAKGTFDPKYATQIEKELLAHPSIQKFMKETLKDQLYIAPLPEKITALLAKEEAYASNLAMRLPIIGHIIRASARAFVTFLNLMRGHMAIDMDTKWLQKVAQKGFEVTDLDYSEMAKLINVSTGRGTIPFGLDKYAVVANATLFSPKLFFSRFEWPTMIFSPSKEVRVEAWKQIGSFLGAVGSILSAAKLSGAGNIELDPRSSDFGKMKIGDTRLDIWTGYAQYIRFMAQLATAERKTTGGYIQSLTRGEVLGRFMTSKLSPAAGLLNDILKGQTYLGEEFPAKSAKGILGQLYQRTFPLAMQDMVDGFVQSGILGGFVSSVGIFGVGVTTYMNEAKLERDKVAKKQDFNRDGIPDGLTWDEVGLKIGRATQLRLEQTTPAILEAEQEQERRFATGTPTITTQFWNEGQAIEDTYREAIKFAVNSFKKTGDGSQFRTDVDYANHDRRTAYSSRARRTEYQDIMAYYNQPLTPEQKAKMNPGDVLRREYNQDMFAADMYDPDTNKYDFDEAERREQKFLVKYGQQALDYIEDYSAARWVDKPAELKMLEQAKDLLRPYWQITDTIWALYPKGLQELSDRIVDIARTDERTAKQMLRQYPQILRARELIARYKARMRQYNPAIKQAYKLYYSY